MLRAIELLCSAPARPGLLCKGSREDFTFEMCSFGMHDREGSILDVNPCSSDKQHQDSGCCIWSGDQIAQDNASWMEMRERTPRVF